MTRGEVIPSEIPSQLQATRLKLLRSRPSLHITPLPSPLCLSLLFLFLSIIISSQQPNPFQSIHTQINRHDVCIKDLGGGR